MYRYIIIQYMRFSLKNRTLINSIPCLSLPIYDEGVFCRMSGSLPKLTNPQLIYECTWQTISTILIILSTKHIVSSNFERRKRLSGFRNLMVSIANYFYTPWKRLYFIPNWFTGKTWFESACFPNRNNTGKNKTFRKTVTNFSENTLLAEF